MPLNEVSGRLLGVDAEQAFEQLAATQDLKWVFPASLSRKSLSLHYLATEFISGTSQLLHKMLKEGTSGATPAGIAPFLEMNQGED